MYIYIYIYIWRRAETPPPEAGHNTRGMRRGYAAHIYIYIYIYIRKIAQNNLIIWGMRRGYAAAMVGMRRGYAAACFSYFLPKNINFIT